MATIETLETKLRELPADMLGEVEDFVEFLLEKRRRAELEQQAVAHGWPPGFFAQTAGSIPDFPDVDGLMGGIDPALDDVSGMWVYGRQGLSMPLCGGLSL
jgi:hypothetical protein